MEVNVGIYPREDNKGFLRYAIIRVDLEEKELLAIDEDFQIRHAEIVKKTMEQEIQGTLDMLMDSQPEESR